jgi:hypothetical protein
MKTITWETNKGGMIIKTIPWETNFVKIPLFLILALSLSAYRVAKQVIVFCIRERQKCFWD